MLINLKILNFFILFNSILFSGIDPSGWVSLQKKPTVLNEEACEQSEGWVVFSKAMQLEKFTVQFPAEPDYCYAQGGLVVSSVRNKEKFNLFVHEISDVCPLRQRIEAIQSMPEASLLQIEALTEETLDLFYQIEKKWVRESILTTPYHTYIFQTFSDDFSVKNHSFFVNSLYVKAPF
jgi:hypothetical protein